MFVLPLVLSAAFASVAFGQNNSALQIEAIEAHFNNSGIVPSLLATFTPTSVFSLSFQGTGDVTPGQAFTDNTKVAPAPNLTVTGGTFNAGDLFTLAMVDAGPVGTDESQGQTRHWLVNGVTLTGSASPFTVSTENATAITEYAGPAPPPGSGPHRYVILLYSQPSDFQAPDGLNTPNIGVSTFNFPSYVQDSHLGTLVAGTYFTVEAGAASFTPSATSPVVTSTLPAATASSASSGSGSPTSSGGAPAPTGGKESDAKAGKAISAAAVFGAVAIAVIFN